FTHASFDVQALPSSHGRELFACWHPAYIGRASCRQGLPSLQSSGVPPAHDPSAHVSFVVQALPSSHGAWFAACVHPVFRSHPSSVHTLPSSQFVAGPPTHCPFTHASFDVQALPSSHGRELFACWHPA